MHALSIQGLQRRIVWLAVAIVLATGVLVAVSVLLPMQSEMRTAADLHIRHSLDVKHLAVDEHLSRLLDVGRQIVSRTQIRKRLIDYNLGKTSQENVRSFSNPRLADALKEAPEALGMVRFDKNNQPVSMVGAVPPQEVWHEIINPDAPAFLLGPVLVEGHPVVFVVTTIFDGDGERHGTDIVMFQLNGLAAILTGAGMNGAMEGARGRSSVLLENSTDTARAFGAFDLMDMRFIDPPLRWARPDEIRASDNTVIVVRGADGVERALSSTSLDRSDWVLVEMEATETLYADARHTLQQAVFVIAVMIAIGSFAVHGFMRTLTGRVLVTAADLQRQVAERKRAQKQILQAKEEAEKANQAKSEFLASMSHELRTPLNAVLGFGQLLQIDPNNVLSPTQQDHVQSILDGGEHLLELVNQLLDLAKIEANQAPLNLTDVSVEEVISDCISMTKPLGAARGITIVSALDFGTSAQLRTDPLRVRQILLNLLSNAVKYNKDGGTVSVEGWVTKSNFFHIAVKDTGRGITVKDHPKVFSMFHRLGDDPNIAREGTGIGLAVTKLLVERMAGRIGFESEIGVGSTFWIELPLSTNTEAVIWMEALRVGVDALDRDHQRIITVLNKIIHQSPGDRGLEDAIAELTHHAQDHFQCEEAVMEACAYPELKTHKALHAQLTQQVAALENAWRAHGDPAVLDRLKKRIREEWLNHIQQDDVKMARYTEGREADIRKALENMHAFDGDDFRSVEPHS